MCAAVHCNYAHVLLTVDSAGQEYSTRRWDAHQTFPDNNQLTRRLLRTWAPLRTFSLLTFSRFLYFLSCFPGFRILVFSFFSFSGYFVFFLFSSSFLLDFSLSSLFLPFLFLLLSLFLFFPLFLLVFSFPFFLLFSLHSCFFSFSVRCRRSPPPLSLPYFLFSLIFPPYRSQFSFRIFVFFPFPFPILPFFLHFFPLTSFVPLGSSLHCILTSLSLSCFPSSHTQTLFFLVLSSSLRIFLPNLLSLF